jgi:hypothetical protein
MFDELIKLALPIVLSAVALFLASFLSWMVFGLHARDWKPLPNEEQVMDTVRGWGTPVGVYMFPYCGSSKDMGKPEFQAKFEKGPRGILQVYPNTGMGAKLPLTFLHFLVCSFAFAYLAQIAFKPGEEFLNVFRFVFTVGLFTFLSAMVAQRIWFHVRITGHIIESIAYAAISAAIFAGMWPAK